MRIQMLKRGRYEQDEVDGALSELGLTATVSGNMFLVQAAKTSVGHAIGKVIKEKKMSQFLLLRCIKWFQVPLR